MSKSKGSKDAGSPPGKLAPLSIPKVFVTSEDALSATPPLQDKDLAMILLQRGQGYRRDEDSGSDCPLLDSGAATPLGENPSIPLNMGTFLASMEILKLWLYSCSEGLILPFSFQQAHKS